MKKKLLTLFLVTISILSKESYAQVTVYAPIPYTTGFESGTLDANWFTTSSATGGRIQIWNSTSLTWTTMTAVAHTDSLWLGLDNSPGGTYITNEAWFGLNLNAETNVRLSFWWAEWNDELEPEDGVYISDNGGTTFTKVLDLNGPSYTDLQWNRFDLSLDSINTFYSLNFTSTYVVKLQQRDNYYFAGGNDGFLFDDIDVYHPCTPTTSGIDTQTACDSLTWIDGFTYTTSNNTATFNIVNGNSFGCDSIVTLNLTINNSTTSIDTQTACDSLTWIDGFTYTTSNNTSTFNIVNGNSFGCDSLVTLNLTINNSTTGIDTQTACDSLTWIDGFTYAASNNTATFNIVNGNSFGCDSIVTLNLTINAVNTTITNTSPTLTANQIGANYRWLDCDNSYAFISGETNQSFTATTSGNYAVEITFNSCTDTSLCENVIISGIEEKNNIVTSVYPNPTTDIVTIVLTNNTTQLSYSIMNVEGKILKESATLNQNQLSIDLNNYPNGIYILNLQTKETSQSIKITKQ